MGEKWSKVERSIVMQERMTTPKKVNLNGYWQFKVLVMLYYMVLNKHKIKILGNDVTKCKRKINRGKVLKDPYIFGN